VTVSRLAPVLGLRGGKQEFAAGLCPSILVRIQVLAVFSALWRAVNVVVSANISKGWRKLATTSPSSQLQFNRTKLSRRRFSHGSCRANSRWAFGAEQSINVTTYKPDTDKRARLIALTDLFAGRSVRLPWRAGWREEFVAELLSFPGRKCWNGSLPAVIGGNVENSRATWSTKKKCSIA
jgi:hypothetical protein